MVLRNLFHSDDEQRPDEAAHSDTEPLVLSALFQYVNAAYLFVPREYQRPEKPIIKRIATNFDPDLFGALTVNLRHYGDGAGRYAVIDGQQRLAAIHRMGYGDQNLPCLVHHGLSAQVEADLFWRMNSRVGRTPLTAPEVFHGRLVAEDPGALDIQSIAAEYGYDLWFGQRDPRNKNLISAIGTLDRIYTQRNGGDALRRTLALTRDAWNGEAGSTKGVLLWALHTFDRAYRGIYDRQRFVRILSELSPGRVISDGQETARILSGATATGILRSLVGLYNKRTRSGRLPEPGVSE